MAEIANAYLGDIWWARLLLQRGLAAIYLVAFISALNQFRPLLGENGLLPVPRFLRRRTLREVPSIFHFHYSDRFFAVTAWVGIVLSVIALLGVFDVGLPGVPGLSLVVSLGWSPALCWGISTFIWLVLYLTYLSIVNVGQTFYGFGWESMLLEAGFFAIFLGSSFYEASPIPVLILRWMLFRVELGAGLIKLRHDRCWRELTCLYYHHETQPLPGPLSRRFHHLPKGAHRAGVLFSHFVQLIAPFLLFFPQPVASLAGVFIVAHQLMLVVSGNYAWLNWLTIVLGLSAFSDGALGLSSASTAIELLPRPVWIDVLYFTLVGVTVVLSIAPTRNFFSVRQRMNFSYNPFHIVGAYGAFGSVTKTRYEIVVEGTHDDPSDPDANWLEYPFRAKPGDPARRPPQVAPYHLRLDWLVWFLPFSVTVLHGRVYTGGHDVWFLRFVRKLLEGDRPVTRLLRRDPFEGSPPRYIRALYYRYEFTNDEVHRSTGTIWKRELLGEYLPPCSKEDLDLEVA